MIYTIFIIPFLMILVGILMFKYPPKKINPFIGYRTSKSMKNQKNWNFANNYAGKLCINIGIIMTFFSIILFIMNYFSILSFTENTILIITFSELIILIFLIFTVEKKIK